MHSSRTFWIAACCAALLGGCGAGSSSPVPDVRAQCPAGQAVEVDGRRRLALVVGVADYQSARVPDLRGTVNDARRVYDLLTERDGFGFPAENVCLLLDEQATTESFRHAFRTTLIERARPDDIAVFYFAGHGSQARDGSGDEPDGWDETFLFHDARNGDVHDFRDDELNALLQELHRKTRNVTVILDSCNSGTATRSDSRFAARFLVPEHGSPLDSGTQGDGGAGPTAVDLSGLVTLTAASDGTPALERDGRGVFTDALLEVLGRASERPLTYAQLARRVPPLVAAESSQVPYFQGMLQRAVFDNRGRTRPLGLDVVTAGKALVLSGPVLPGIGVGAELRIYDGAAGGDEVSDPAKAKASAIVTALRGVTVEARPTATRAGALPVAVGDLAVVSRPADDYLKLRVRLNLGESDQDRRRETRLADSIRNHPDAGHLVALVTAGEDFELGKVDAGRLVLRGPENTVRNTFEADDKVAPALWRHARQRALLQMHGEGGDDFADNQTLQLQLIPAARQSPCADGEWHQAPANTDQVVPLCHAWNVRVTLSENAPMPLLIGAAVLSADGAMFGLPRDGKTVRLAPGESFVFADGETFRGTPPLTSADRVVAFGTRERNPVAWHLLTQSGADGEGPAPGAADPVERFLHPAAALPRSIQTWDTLTWTMSSIGVRVEANERFLNARDTGPVRAREYTIADFDVRPYLPDDTGSALRRVLEVADGLARAAGNDGIPYKQHDWSLGTDAANLDRGIDCSRSIWFAFTRANLPFNRDDRYLFTGAMVGEDSLMHDEFDVCPATEPYRPGDVLVYRSAERGDGHTVMVIDAAKRIAWGSMGWDGNAQASDYAVLPDVGVEYQRIKFKPDWRRWDRRDMTLQTCWRHRRFASEFESGAGRPGTEALVSACNPALCAVSRDTVLNDRSKGANRSEEAIRE